MKFILPVLLATASLQTLPVLAQDAGQSGEPIKGSVRVNVDQQPLRLVRPSSAFHAQASQSGEPSLPALKSLTPQYDSFIGADAFKTSAKSTKLEGGVKVTAKPTKIQGAARNDVQTGAIANTSRSLTAQLAAESLAKLNHVFSTGAAATAPPAVPSGREAPYIWVQASVGGYYDASHTTPNVVTADQLYRYGGKFADGTPVPTEPIASLNSMGHAYHKGSLATDSFWYKK